MSDMMALAGEGESPMQLHYSYACDDCIKRFIGPALDRVFDVEVPAHVRDRCEGCGFDDVIVRRFSYWFPYSESEV